MQVKPRRDIEKKVAKMPIEEVRARLNAIRCRPEARVEGTLAQGLLGASAQAAAMLPGMDKDYVRDAIANDIALQDSVEELIQMEVLPWLPTTSKALVLASGHLLIGWARGLPAWLARKKPKHNEEVVVDDADKEEEEDG